MTRFNPVVAGLSMQMSVAGNDSSPLAGPAIYAALGLRCAGLSVRLLTAVSKDLPDHDNDILDFIDNSPDRLTTVLPRPMIAWNSAAVLGDHGKGQMSDDPALWRAMPVSMAALENQPLVLANGDPDWYQSLLAAARPSFIFMDVHMEWLRFREKALNACMQKANVVTITETEYKALPVSARSGGIFNGDNKALIIKRGKQGVTILADRASRDLPPPSPSHIGTDVGCGDFLIGLLAGHFLAGAAAESPVCSIDRLSDAYLASVTELSGLIESGSPSSFLRQSVQRICAKQ